MLYIGLMSGTSMDAIDTALIRIESGSLNLLEYEQFSIADDLRRAVRDISPESSLEEVTRVDAELGHIFADAVLKIMDRAGIQLTEIKGIGCHGQTVLHYPDDHPPRTLQIGDASIIAYRTGVITVTDFRRMDMAAGGQGAPLAPALHAHFFRSTETDRIILNIGGIANITLLPSASGSLVTGFDTGPGNGLLDDWNRRHNNTSMDKDGEWAATGKIDHSLLEDLLSDPYFSAPPPKSSGRDYFNLRWLDSIQRGKNKLPARDVQATLVQLTARNISGAIKLHAPANSEVYVCGGGIHNPVLMAALESCLPDRKITSTEQLGIHPDAVEAVTFAWLAHCRLNKIPGNLPSVTGADRPVILGAVYESGKSEK